MEPGAIQTCEALARNTDYVRCCANRSRHTFSLSALFCVRRMLCFFQRNVRTFGESREPNLSVCGNCYLYCPDCFGLIFQAVWLTDATRESACANKLFSAFRSVSVQERGLPAAFRITLDLDLISDWVCAGSSGKSLESGSVPLSNATLLR
jgi:hypothetical protein